MRGPFAYHVVIDVAGTPDAVLARMRTRLHGDLHWTSGLVAPTRKVGAGPPDYLGRIAGRSFTLHTSWRPTFSRGHESALEVAGVVEPGVQGTRVRAFIRPRPIQYLVWAPAVVAVALGFLQAQSWPALAVMPAVTVLYWLTIVPRDITWAAAGLHALVAAPEDSPTAPS